MILEEKTSIRTDVENLFLMEMVEQDRKFLFLGENDDSIIDYMAEETVNSKSLFEDSLISEEDEDDDLSDDVYYEKYGI